MFGAGAGPDPVCGPGVNRRAAWTSPHSTRSSAWRADRRPNLEPIHNRGDTLAKELTQLLESCAAIRNVSAENLWGSLAEGFLSGDLIAPEASRTNAFSLGQQLGSLGVTEQSAAMKL